MGRGTITDEQGVGQYTISLDYGESVIQQRIDALDALIATHANTITAVEDALTTLESLRDSQFFTLQGKIADLGDAPSDEARKEVADLTKAYQGNVAIIREYRLRLGYARVQKSDAEKQKARLEAIQLTESKTVWCADYTTEATGEVATIEIDGEQPGILIAPGAPAHDTSYGTLIDRMAVTPEAAFLNGAILPGWQKYSPTYRVGQIADIDRENDLCTVYLDDATSSAQGLDINQASALFDVPIEYMTCNSAAFENWDRVVVKFEGQAWSSPKVIGFESNPKLCAPLEVAFAIEAGTVSFGTAIGDGAMYLGYNDPDEDEVISGGISESITSTFGFPPGGYANLSPRAEDRFASSGTTSEAVIRFDLAMERREYDYFGEPGEGGNSIVRDLSVEGYSETTTLGGSGGGSISSPAVGPRISTSSDNRSPVTVQNGDGEDISFLTGTVVQATLYANRNINNEDVFADAEAYSAIMLSYYSPPSSLVIEYGGKRCQFTLKLMGPTITVQNYDSTFLYTPYDDVGTVQSTFKRWLWITYEFDQVLPN